MSLREAGSVNTDPMLVPDTYPQDEELAEYEELIESIDGGEEEDK